MPVRGEKGAGTEADTPDMAFSEPEDRRLDEVTDETLTYLAQARREHRRARLRRLVFVCYAALLVVGLYGLASGVYLDDAVATGRLHVAVSAWVFAALPAGLTALFLLVLVTRVQDATWRGPIGVDAAAAAWLLPLPLRRERLLRPRLVAGAAAGAVVGFALHVMALGALSATVAAGAVAGSLVMVLACAVGSFIQRFRGIAAHARRWAFTLLLVPLLFGVAALLAGFGHEAPWLNLALMWSGPWGWATQPLVAVVGGYAPAWPLATALLAATTTLALLAAARTVSGVPAAVLRSRAQTVRNVSSAMMAIQPRQALLAMRFARGPGTPRRFRFRAPGRRFLIVPWRDVTSLLQYPGRLAGSLVLLISAHCLATLAASTGGVILTLLVVTVAYLGAAQVVEPARLEADDTHRSEILPYRYGTLALLHAVVPTAVLVITGAAVVGMLSIVGGPAAPGLPLIMATPSLVGAALVSAYRGVLSQGLLTQLFVGMDTGTPFGDITPVIVALWYVRAPLAALALLLPPLHWVLRPAGASPSVFVASAVWLTATAALLLVWANRRANTWYRAQR